MRIDDGLGPLVELAASRHNAFDTAEAAEIGIIPRRLSRARQRGLLVSLYPRVWAFKSRAPTAHQRIRAATLTTGGAAGFLSSAWLYGWIDRPPPVPQVWISGISRPRGKPIDIHQAKRVCLDRDVITVDHIKTLNKAATLCLLGSVAPKLLVEKCLDEFLRTESETWLDLTFERLRTATGKGPRVLANVRSGPSRVEGATDSWLERVCVGLLSVPALPPIVLQHEVKVDGRSFRLDLACPELMLGIEVHSRSFHFGPGAEDADNVRDLLLATQGWKLLYVTYSQLLSPDELVRQFLAAARARANQLGVSMS